MPEHGDEIWKRAIHNLFRPMVEFLLPKMNADIDWTKGHLFLEQELANLFTPEKEGKGFVDVLAQVYLFDGTESYILFHIEVQGYGSGESDIMEFEERMFQYFYRVRDKWKKNVASLAILTDGNKNYRPDRYEYSLYGTSLTYVFNVSKIIDYDEDELEQNPNPFAMLMLAAKRAIKANLGDDETKKLFKLSLIRLLRRRGHTSEDIDTLFFFVDWIILISNKEMELQCAREMLDIIRAGGTEMPYVTTIEKYLTKKIWEEANEKIEEAREKAWEEAWQEAWQEASAKGVGKAKSEAIFKMLDRNMDIAVIADILDLSEEQVRELAGDRAN